MGWSSELLTLAAVTPLGRWIRRLKCHFLCVQSHLCWFNPREQTPSNYLRSADMSSVAWNTQSLGKV